MARVTRIAKAQQRYKMVPVIDPETGEQAKVLVTRRGTGDAKKTKRGSEVYRYLTKPDRTQPLPMPRCDYSGCEDREIKVGQAYMRISPRSGPYGGRTLFRHGDHPVWNVWEYSSSMSAELARISHDFQTTLAAGFESPEDVQAALEEAAGQVRELAEQKRESASNMEEGFGHSTYQSDELNEVADSLESWADEIEGADIPDLPDYECDTCDSTGEVKDEDDEDAEPETCPDCEGDTDNPTEAQMEEWRDEVESACSIVDESPV